MKHEKLAKCQRILRLVLEFFPIFPPGFTNFICFFLTLRNLGLIEKVIFEPFLQNVVSAKFEQRDSH